MKEKHSRHVNSVEIQEAASIILEALSSKGIDFFVGIFAMQVLVKNAEAEFNFESEIRRVPVEVH